jgi:thiamine-monophosphate kinase
MSSTRLSQIGELSLLEQIRRSFLNKSGRVPVGIGDDAAVLRPRDEYLLVTTDMMVEGVHFDLRFITAYQLGFKLVSVNVSDIYAMGGKPAYVLLSIAVNGKTEKTFVDMLFDGVKDAVNLYDMYLVGGDLSSTDKDMFLSATIIGSARKFVQRSGAKAGDRIYVTGNLGDSSCGLELLKKMKKSVSFTVRKTKFEGGRAFKIPGLDLSFNETASLIRRHLLPEARNPKHFVRAATSMIDLSDGLLIDLSRLCNESKVGARIYEENIPLSPGLKRAASSLGVSPFKFALSGGEDYELLFTAQPEKKVSAIYLGDITKTKRVIVGTGGNKKTFSAEGYQHFVRKRVL